MAPPPTSALPTRGCSEASPWPRRWPERSIAAEQPRRGETMAGCVQEVSNAAYNLSTRDTTAVPPRHSGGGLGPPAGHGHAAAGLVAHAEPDPLGHDAHH